MIITFKAKSTKTKMGYEGSVVCYIEKKKLWEEPTGITRLTRDDAMVDANVRLARVRTELEYGDYNG